MLELTQQGAVASLRVRRASKKNAFTQAMWQSLWDHCRALAARCAQPTADAPRVLLLQGEGDAFCAGADIEEMSQLVRDAAALAANNRVVSAAQMALENLPLPTLAVIDGPCFGGGLGLAAACDFRIATPSSQFAVTPARLGLLYSLEDTHRLVRLVGDARARRLLLRAEKLDAATALAWGVVDTVVPAAALADVVQQRAQELATQSRTAMLGLKATLAHVSGFGPASEAQVRALYEAAFAGADFAEGAAAFLQRRPALF